MGNLSNAAILVDGQGRSVTAQPAAALATGTSAQSSVLSAGSDYANPANAQVPRIDALGNGYSTPMLGSVPVPVQVNTVTPNPAAYSGNVSLAWDNTNSRFTPFQVDATGAGITRNMLAPTIAYSPTVQVGTGTTAGKNMMSVFNASTTLYQRVLGFYAMCPPQAAVSGGLLQTNTSYTTVGFGVFKITGHSGGTLVAGALHDTRDTYDTAFTCRTASTVTGISTACLYAFDAAYSSVRGYGQREDVGSKIWTMAPGEGITFQSLTALSSSVNFYLRVVCSQNTA
jgi:hypothetical protein